MPVRLYRALVGEAINLGNLYRQAEYKLETKSEESMRVLQEYKKFKQEGRI